MEKNIILFIFFIYLFIYLYISLPSPTVYSILKYYTLAKQIDDKRKRCSIFSFFLFFFFFFFFPIFLSPHFSSIQNQSIGNSSVIAFLIVAPMELCVSCLLFTVYWLLLATILLSHQTARICIQPPIINDCY